MSVLLTRAVRLATALHHDQVDKGGEPYILHPLRVMCKGKDIDEWVLGVMHDTVEDTSYTLHEAGEEFGSYIKEALNAISHRKNEPRRAYLRRVRANPLATKVKLYDIEDNMSLERLRKVDKDTVERLLIKYWEAKGILSGRTK